MTTNLPEQVRRGLAEAEAAEAALAAPPEAPTPEPPAPEPPAPTPEPAPAPEPWEARYRSLQGMYDQDVVAVRRANQDLEREVDNLKRQLAEKPTPAPSPEPKPEVKLTGVTQKDVEAFGDDLIDVIQRAANEIADRQTASLRAEVEALKATTSTVSDTVKTVATAQADDGKAKFFQGLTEKVPDWQTINADPRFHDWCRAIHPLTGEPRQQLIEAAAASLNVDRAAALFETYKHDAGIKAPEPTPEPTPRAELESQIAPGTTRTPTTQAPVSTDKVWTSEEISTFYADCTKGLYRGKDAERDRIEAEINNAVATNRVR